MCSQHIFTEIRSIYGAGHSTFSATVRSCIRSWETSLTTTTLCQNLRHWHVDNFSDVMWKARRCVATPARRKTLLKLESTSPRFAPSCDSAGTCLPEHACVMGKSTIWFTGVFKIRSWLTILGTLIVLLNNLSTMCSVMCSDKMVWTTPTTFSTTCGVASSATISSAVRSKMRLWETSRCRRGSSRLCRLTLSSALTTYLPTLQSHWELGTNRRQICLDQM